MFARSRISRYGLPQDILSQRQEKGGRGEHCTAPLPMGEGVKCQSDEGDLQMDGWTLIIETVFFKDVTLRHAL